MGNKIIYRADWATFNREKFIKPILITIILMLIFIVSVFNPTLQPFMIFGIMASIPTLLILLLLYYNRPSKEHDRKEFVYVQFKDKSLKVSLRKEHTLRGNSRNYLIDEVKYPKIAYQVFEVPYSEITSIERSGGTGAQNSYYRIAYSSNAVISRPGIYIPTIVFEEELRQWLVRLGEEHNIKTFP